MLFGSKESTLTDLTFERATNLAALQLFKCGQDEVDKIIKEDLPSLLPTNDLWLVKDKDEVVALFCLQRDPYCLFLSDRVKEKMKEGQKPKPIAAKQEGVEFWDKFFYESKELTLLAVKKERRNQHLGAFIIESILEMLVNSGEKKELLSVRALNIKDYSAIPFYLKCNFTPAMDQVPGQNLIMYRVIPKPENDANQIGTA